MNCIVNYILSLLLQLTFAFDLTSRMFKRQQHPTIASSRYRSLSLASVRSVFSGEFVRSQPLVCLPRAVQLFALPFGTKQLVSYTLFNPEGPLTG